MSQPRPKLPLDRILAEAIERSAGVVHIEPDAARATVRIRADLSLQRFQTITREEYFVLWQNIADRFGVQQPEPFFEGSFPFQVEGAQHLIRVSLVPTPHGDSIALKINSRETKVLPLDRLGMPEAMLARLRGALTRTRGLVLIAGSSGSGGTTTLLSCLASLADGQRKLISIEDPIEVHLDGVQQIQVKVLRDYPERSITFARSLRATATQNPDVIGISQLRDPETAAAALQASLSGALVLTRLHAASAALAVTRLATLGGSPQLVTDCLRLVIGQALLRRNCPGCLAPAPFPDGLREADRAELAAAQQGTGCVSCHGTGVSGVVPVFELVVGDRNAGHETLAGAARKLVLAGTVPPGEYAKLL